MAEIQNDRELKITQTRLEEFLDYRAREAGRPFNPADMTRSIVLKELELAAIDSMIEDLREQINTYKRTH